MSSSSPEAGAGRRSRREMTVARIADLAGVSAPTVSKVINGHAGVAVDTRRRIEDLIREHGYQRADRTPPASIVEVVFQALDSPWALEIIRGVEQVARGHDLAVALTEMQGHLTPGRGWSDQVRSRRPAGVIAVSAELTRRQLAHLSTAGIPLVVLDPSGEPQHQTPSVGAMNWNGGLTATRHLLDLGHRRIAMINGPDRYLCCRARLDGYRAAMDAAGVPVDPALLRTAPLYVEDGRDAAAALLELPDPPTAVFTGNDLQAIGVYAAARAARIRVPEDLSVVGFDDLTFVQWSDPPLTTVRQPLTDMGATAAQLVMTLAAGARPDHSRIELPTSLVVRHSTAGPPRRS
ncbi:LacI family DNA-binding transcriptional regulator [Dactylosporangium sp. NPDC051541]|uniref:LacI family DNA-binding transcriptional regulator n=1 Tax=Dactylosporangium sp. NPDC051541 TaxID=3363977 RepID=UPI0037AD550F